jgi:hypothetical protein
MPLNLVLLDPCSFLAYVTTCNGLRLTRNRIYVFGSAAYLTALAVTVLIVYLMNPPVSDGVQAAFFVAAFVTGVIFGVLALVFADIADGFGCLLGGFCLSMWLLSLKEGGLITSSTGRAIFIGCMSAGGFSLSFSHYTRNYGLIGSIAFSGATATMLGIDCLARAGLKEFWLYLWNLNDTIFPLHTNTYPLTKNMKAELAGIIIIAVFGIVSQLRVWNLVKDRREKTAADELELQQVKDREEEERGRNLEDTFQKERAQWEAAYGNKNIAESTVGSSTFASPKNSTSIREKELYGSDNLDVVNLAKSGVAAAGTTVTVNVLRDDDIQQIDSQGNPVVDDESTYVGQKTIAITTAPPPPPSIVPLPFIVPTDEYVRADSEDNTSVSAVPESTRDTFTDPKHMSKRVSEMSGNKRFSMNRASRVFSESSEALVHMPSVEDDHASSIAATVDNDNDDMSLRQLSPQVSPVKTEQYDLVVSTTPGKTSDASAVPAAASSTDVKDTSLKAIAPARPSIRHSLTTSTDPKPDVTQKTRSPFRDSRARADTVIASGKGAREEEPTPSSRSDAMSEGSQVDQTAFPGGSVQESAMPERLSKVALSYRTNEWAKHLETADRPDLDDLKSPVPANTISEEGPEEKAVPVSAEIASPLLGSRRNSNRASLGATANFYGLDRSASTFSQKSQVNQRPIMPSPSPQMLSRSNSSAQIDALAPLPSNTLLGKRETLMRKRTSSQSFAPSTSAANLLEQADMENMSLAQRRQVLQNHQATSPGLQHQNSSASQRRSPPSTSQKWQKKGAPQGFDSHQPRRATNSQSDQKREELYAGWRGNIRDVTPPQTQAYIAEQQRAALLSERRQKEMEKQKREATQQQRASKLDSMMRSGPMLDAHREAMRKMQSNAARNAS